MPSKRRICLLAGQFDVTLSVSNGMAAWSRVHDSWRIEVLSSPDAHNISWLERAGYGGIVAVSAGDEMQQELRRLKCPAVCVQVATPGTLPTVNVDDRAIGAAGAEHLLASGYRRFAYYGIDSDWSRRRFEAFAEALRKRGHDPGHQLPREGLAELE